MITTPKHPPGCAAPVVRLFLTQWLLLGTLLITSSLVLFAELHWCKYGQHDRLQFFFMKLNALKDVNCNEPQLDLSLDYFWTKINGKNMIFETLLLKGPYNNNNNKNKYFSMVLLHNHTIFRRSSVILTLRALILAQPVKSGMWMDFIVPAGNVRSHCQVNMKGHQICAEMGRNIPFPCDRIVKGLVK